MVVCLAYMVASSAYIDAHDRVVRLTNDASAGLQSPSIGFLQSIESIESFHFHLSQPSIHHSYLQPYPTHPAPPGCVSFFSLSFHRFALWRLTIFPSSCYAALRVYCLQVLAKPTPTGGVQILAELVPVIPRRDFTGF